MTDMAWVSLALMPKDPALSPKSGGTGTKFHIT